MQSQEEPMGIAGCGPKKRKRKEKKEVSAVLFSLEGGSGGKSPSQQARGPAQGSEGTCFTCRSPGFGPLALHGPPSTASSINNQ